MKSRKLTKDNHTTGLNSGADAVIVRGKHFNDLLDDFNAHIPVDGAGRFEYILPYEEDGTVQIVGQAQDFDYAAADTLTASESGKTIWIQGDNSSSAIVLPPAVHGLNFKFKWAANNTNTITITTADTTDTTGDMFRGGLLVFSTTNLSVFIEATGDVNRMTFDDNLANSASGAGSWVEVACADDGIWIVTGVMNGGTDVDGNGSAIFSDVD